MLGDQRGRKQDKYVKDYVVFDLETTGTSSANDAVVEISAIKVLGGKAADTFHPNSKVLYFMLVKCQIREKGGWN